MRGRQGPTRAAPCRTDSDLAVIADAWRALPEATRAGMVAQTRAVLIVVAAQASEASDAGDVSPEVVADTIIG